MKAKIYLAGPLLKQLDNPILPKPQVVINDKHIDELERDDIELVDYQSAEPLEFGVAE